MVQMESFARPTETNGPHGAVRMLPCLRTSLGLGSLRNGSFQRIRAIPWSGSAPHVWHPEITSVN
jgi:hypothetical protein